MQSCYDISVMVTTERAFWKMKELVLGSRLSYMSKQ
jgi:hypothetical protein